MNEQKLPCEIVQDLLPLYLDGVVNDVTGNSVKAHLEECESCSMEYRLLTSELPVCTETTAGLRFAAFSQKLKKKRIVTAVIASVLACIVLCFGLYLLTQVPTVPIPVNEFQFYRVCRYEVDGEQFFFLMYTHPLYDAPTSGLFDLETSSTGDPTLVVKWRKPIISSKMGDTNPQIMTTTLHGSDGRYGALRFNDAVIWSEAENGQEPVPSYVYEIHENSVPGFSYNLDISGNRLEVFFDDGRMMEWDLDGNLLYDSAA